MLAKREVSAPQKQKPTIGYDPLPILINYLGPILMLSFNSFIGFPNELFIRSFIITVLYAFLVSHILASCPT
jgi:hypothetical protein